MNNREDMKKIMESLDSMYRDENVDAAVADIRRSIYHMSTILKEKENLEEWQEFSAASSRFLIFLERYRTV